MGQDIIGILYVWGLRGAKSLNSRHRRDKWGSIISLGRYLDLYGVKFYSFSKKLGNGTSIFFFLAR